MPDQLRFPHAWFATAIYDGMTRTTMSFTSHQLPPPDVFNNVEYLYTRDIHTCLYYVHFNTKSLLHKIFCLDE